MMAAKDDVMTTRLTVGADFLMDFKMPVVPITAGSSRSWEVVSRLELSPALSAPYFLHVGDIEVERAGGMQHSFKGRIRHDSLVEGAFLCNVWHDGETQLALFDG